MFGRTVRELEQEIRATELRVIEHDWRLQAGWQRLRHEAGRATALRGAAAAGLVALGWLLHRPRGRKREVALLAAGRAEVRNGAKLMISMIRVTRRDGSSAEGLPIGVPVHFGELLPPPPGGYCSNAESEFRP